MTDQEWIEAYTAVLLKQAEAITHESDPDPLLLVAAGEVKKYTPAIQDAMAADDAPRAVRLALYVGLHAGRTLDGPQLSRLRRIEPDADIGRRVRGGGSNSTELTPAQIQKVCDQMERYAARREVAWSAAAEEIGKQYSVSGRTIRRATKHLKYPRPKK